MEQSKGKRKETTTQFSLNIRVKKGCFLGFFGGFFFFFGCSLQWKNCFHSSISFLLISKHVMKMKLDVPLKKQLSRKQLFCSIWRWLSPNSFQAVSQKVPEEVQLWRLGHNRLQGRDQLVFSHSALLPRSPSWLWQLCQEVREMLAFSLGKGAPVPPRGAGELALSDPTMLIWQTLKVDCGPEDDFGGIWKFHALISFNVPHERTNHKEQ